MNAASTEPSHPAVPPAAPQRAPKTAIVPFAAEHVAVVREFNARLREHGVPFRFPEDPTPDWLPKLDDLPLFHEYFLAVEAESGAVRGGYIFKQQEFAIGGAVQPVGFFRLPLSEGVYDKPFASLAAQFLLHALKKSPRLYSLGIGGYDEPLAQMEASVGWKQWTVPFLFRIEHAFKFLRNIRHLRRRASRRIALDLLAFSGLGFVGLQLLRLKQKLFDGKTASVPTYTLELSFGLWADEVWSAARSEYSLIAVRTAETLNRLYPADDARYQRLKVTIEGRTVGWAVVLNTQHHDHKHFGNMRLGSLVDFLAVPGYHEPVIAAATDHLRRGGGDLIVVNTSNDAWVTALKRQGYFAGPSNFIFSGSKKLIEVLEPFQQTRHRMHWTRGDGDGPIHL